MSGTREMYPRRVRLAPFEDQPEQFGYVAEDPFDIWLPTAGADPSCDTMIVFLDKEYRDGDEDGMREVTVDQVTFVEEK